MPLRTVIFIDGENFRNSLRQFSYRSDPPHPNNQFYRLEERHFIWRDFFRGVIEQFGAATGLEYQLIRVGPFEPEDCQYRKSRLRYHDG